MEMMMGLLLQGLRTIVALVPKFTLESGALLVRLTYVFLSLRCLVVGRRSRL